MDEPNENEMNAENASTEDLSASVDQVEEAFEQEEAEAEKLERELEG